MAGRHIWNLSAPVPRLPCALFASHLAPAKFGVCTLSALSPSAIDFLAAREIQRASLDAHSIDVGRPAIPLRPVPLQFRQFPVKEAVPLVFGEQRGGQAED
jgi:hypothetical protein